MILLTKTLKFGLLMFIPFALVAFYFSGYYCSDTRSLTSNCEYYQIIFTVLAPFLFSFIVQLLNILFIERTSLSTQTKVNKVDKGARRVFAIPIAIFVFVLSVVFVSFSVYPDTTNFINILTVTISAIIAIIVFKNLNKN